jgi:TRAP-type C4-dicarboxylate transport system substrate-binding protein
MRDIAAKHLNAAAVSERADMAALNTSLQSDLVAKGMVFNTPRTDAFRDKLHKAGYYSEWKSKFGEEAWSALERYAGKLG